MMDSKEHVDGLEGSVDPPSRWQGFWQSSPPPIQAAGQGGYGSHWSNGGHSQDSWRPQERWGCKGAQLVR